MANVAWTTPKMTESLEQQAAEAKALAESHTMKTEEGREIIARLQRLIETLLHGEPTTPLPSRHHK